MHSFKFRSLKFFIFAVIILFVPIFISAFFFKSFFEVLKWRSETLLLFTSVVFLLSELPIHRHIISAMQIFLVSVCFIFNSLECISFFMTSKSFAFSFFVHFNFNSIIYSGHHMIAVLGLVIILTAIALICLLFIKLNSAKLDNRYFYLILALGLHSYIYLESDYKKFPPYAFYREYQDFQTKKPVKFNEANAMSLGINTKLTSNDKAYAKGNKNLVLIFLESIENSYLDEKNFPNLIPCISKLSSHNSINFANIIMAPNAKFTFAGIFSALTGGVLINRYLLHGLGLGNIGYKSNIGDKLPSLPEVLKLANYQQVFMRGADLKFSRIDKLLKRLKYDEMYDYRIFNGKEFDQSMYSHWGVRDRGLFSIAYDKYIQLNKNNKPFNLTMLTLDSHHPYGYPHPKGKKYGDGNSSLLNAIHDTDYQLMRFINRLKSTKYWKNTIVVLVTDHIAMRNSVYKTLEKNKNRGLIFLALNAGKPNIINTPGATFDIGPTIIDLLGVKTNISFPIGESLLRKTNPKRLIWNKEKEEQWDAFCLMHSSSV